ncbi:hypothetical protein [Moraxella sp. VT-16-12]|uniref:hypothetical protein n=1 Tax=Moraxella sp. VT-16-12 TaxID=2014877 RepID=UPI000B7FEB45|nr:hypothetical protein [Moraxella sp. VT-16-12]TWV84048.1 hypothetical protein CEW93_002650 [Moraxella sp. VT-16-12]
MNQEQFWQNFELGTELDIALTFVYDGLKCFDDLEYLNDTSDVFHCLYHLSVGFERVFKIGIILREFNDGVSVDNIESSLITHDTNHLFDRLSKNYLIDSKDFFNLGKNHKEFLCLLGKFYKTYRYDRFSMSVKEKNESLDLISFFQKYLTDGLEKDNFSNVYTNNEKIKKFLNKTVLKIIQKSYELICNEAQNKNLYTHELKYDSKAFHLINCSSYDKFCLSDMKYSQKEILIWLLNNTKVSSYQKFIRDIKPLDLDIALLDEYLKFLFGNFSSTVLSEIECLYEKEINIKERLNSLSVIGDGSLLFEDDLSR